MLIAINNKGNKIRPHKGGNGLCPFCGGAVIAACGDINTHHWRHDASTNCDPWSEHETEWHRNWKAKFPEAWREYIINKGDEKHIADIRTDSGLVVEFQNSSISNTTIQVREDFYENMIWVINAIGFKDNFEIRSMVRTKLRENEHRYNSYLSYNIQEEDSLIKYEEKIEEYNSSIRSTNLEIGRSERALEECDNFLSEIDSTINQLLGSRYFYNVIVEFESNSIHSIKEVEKEITLAEQTVQQIEKELQQIRDLKNCTLPKFEHFKVVPFSLVSPASFRKCKLVKTESIHTFFPEFTELNSEDNFRYYSRHEKTYTLLIDLSENINSLNRKLETEKSIIRDLERNKSQAFAALQIELKEWLISKRNSEKQNIKDYLNRIDYFESEIEQIRVEQKEERERIINENEEVEQELEQEKTKEEISIKRSYKGKYSYYWKHRRKSWDYAGSPIYLDFGTHIFELIDDSYLKKMDSAEFINSILNNNGSPATFTSTAH